MSVQQALFVSGEPWDWRAVLSAVTSGSSPSTVTRYAPSVRSWLIYCADRAIDPCDAPTDAVVAWLDNRLRRAPSRSSMTCSLAGLRCVQRSALFVRSEHDQPLPYTLAARPRLALWARGVLTAPAHQATPITGDKLCRIVAELRRPALASKGCTLDRARALQARDIALVLLGWWGALRADDLARLLARDVNCVPEGLELQLQASKTGPALLALAHYRERDLCPVIAWRSWLDFHAAGYDFHSASTAFGITAQQVSWRIAVAAARTGLRGNYSGHSLRAGFATEAAKQGIPDRHVQRHARWTSAATHQTYVRAGLLWVETPTKAITLPSSLAVPGAAVPVALSVASLAAPGA